MGIANNANMFHAEFNDVSLGQVVEPGIILSDASDVIQQLIPRTVGARIRAMGGGILTLTFQTRLDKTDKKTALDFFLALPATISRNLATLKFTMEGDQTSVTSAAYISFSAKPRGAKGWYFIDWTFVVSDQTQGSI